MELLTATQFLAFFLMLIFAAAGACTGLGVGTKMRPVSPRFLTSTYGFEVAAGSLFLWLVTFQPWLQIGFLVGGGAGVYQALKGKKKKASRPFGWLVFLSSLVPVLMTTLLEEDFF